MFDPKQRFILKQMNISSFQQKHPVFWRWVPRDISGLQFNCACVRIRATVCNNDASTN